MKFTLKNEVEPSRSHFIYSWRKIRSATQADSVEYFDKPCENHVNISGYFISNFREFIAVSVVPLYLITRIACFEIGLVTVAEPIESSFT